MAKIGYMMLSHNYDTAEQDLAWMKDFGCDEIIQEPVPSNTKSRSMWDGLLAKLTVGDALVVPKFSNALRGAKQLLYFLEYCRVNDVRIISLHDKIDSKDILFPNTKTSDVLTAIALLPREAHSARKAKNHVKKIRKHIHSLSASSIKKAERNKTVVNMYLQGYSINDIFECSGFKSRSSVFRILNDAKVNLNRGRTKGPLGPRKKVSDDTDTDVQVATEDTSE